jgi:hypothetical protein
LTTIVMVAGSEIEREVLGDVGDGRAIHCEEAAF